MALLVYGLTTKATNSTIDDALSRGEAVPAPGFTLSALADGSRRRRRLVARRRRRLGVPARAARHAAGAQLLGLLVRPVPGGGEGARAGLEAAAAGDVLFVGLDAQDAREDARDFIAQFGLTFPHVRDPGNDTQRAWGVTGLPETYFIAADGRVVGHVIGTVDDEQLRDGHRPPRRPGGPRAPRTAASSARSASCARAGPRPARRCGTPAGSPAPRP